MYALIARSCSPHATTIHTQILTVLTITVVSIGSDNDDGEQNALPGLITTVSRLGHTL